MKPPAGGTTTLTGTIAAGVEPNCLLLDDHLLIINDPAQRAAAKPGASVTAAGRAEQGMMTTCPRRIRCTSLPTSSTMPMASWPMR